MAGLRGLRKKSPGGRKRGARSSHNCGGVDKIAVIESRADARGGRGKQNLQIPATKKTGVAVRFLRRGKKKGYEPRD